MESTCSLPRMCLLKGLLMIKMDVKIDSLILHQTVDIKVALPCSILNLGKRFKSVLALHCAMSTADIFFDRLAMLDYVEEYKIAVIAPSIPNNTFFVNSTLGRYGDFLDKEMMPLLRNILPVSGKREDNTVLGISMGAYGALSMILRKPDAFSNVVAISGYYDQALPFDKELGADKNTFAVANIIQPYMSEIFKQSYNESPDDLILKLRSYQYSDPTRFMFYSEKNDPLSVSQTKRLYKIARDCNLSASYKEGYGKHDVSAWKSSIKDAMANIHGS